jgi:hypothetical protein
LANSMNSEPPTLPPSNPGDTFSQSAFTEKPVPFRAYSPSQVGSHSATQSHSFHSFGEYSQFLRSAVADEESLQVGESLQVLAVQIEALVTMMHPREGARPPLALALIELVGDLRTHRVLLLSLGGDWHRFYEFDAHFAALNHFRILVTQWAMDAAPPHHAVPPATDFDLAAWRVLGAGALLLDVYEQSRKAAAEIDTQPVESTVWARWRAWWARRKIRQKVVRQKGSRGRRKSD